MCGGVEVLEMAQWLRTLDTLTDNEFCSQHSHGGLQLSVTPAQDLVCSFISMDTVIIYAQTHN